MDTSEQNNFEDNWRKAFDDASDTPPDSVWARIEERLDDEENERVVVLPLWRRWQGMHWVAAAGVALLAISLGGWWLSQNSGSGSLHGNLAHNQSKILIQKTEKTATLPGKKSEPKVATSPQINQSSSESEEKEVEKIDLNPLEISKEKTIAQIQTNNSKTKSRDKATNVTVPSNPQKGFGIKESNEVTQIHTAKTPGSLISEKSNSVLKESVQSTTVNTDPLTISTPTLASASSLEINSLDGKNLRSLLGLSKKQPWVAYQAPENEVPASKKASTKEYWASVGIMPASYNAGVAIGGSTAGRAFASAGQNALANTSNSTNAGTNRSALSYAVQWQGGLQLNQRWSIETGVNYLQGNSVFEGTNGFNVYTNSYVNNLEAAVNLSNNMTKQYDFVSAGADKSQIQSFATDQNISNSYQYLQVPVQAGFALLKPKRKLSLWLLGGIINNIFLRNSFDSGQQRIVSVSGADNPYKTLSLSAGTGMRVQYKMSKRWTTLVSGNYQHSLGSNTRSNALFEAKPQLFGIGAGLRYGF
ncbi:hypothetical protein [Runella sp.]|uniref:hypothetical protein n=1 Tax=Runella sp. TaxID=1960881 RepID=UPI003D1365E1